MKNIWIEIMVVGWMHGFLIAFLSSLIVKWGFAHRFDHAMRSRGSQRRYCFFCVSFWMAVAYALMYVALFASWNVEYVLIVPISTMVGVHATLHTS